MLAWLASCGLQAQAAAAVEHEIEVSLTPHSGEIEIVDRLVVSGSEGYRFGLAPWLDVKRFLLDGEIAVVTRRDDNYFVALADAGRHELEFTLWGQVPLRNDAESSNARYGSSGDDGVYLPGQVGWIAHDWSLPAMYRLEVTVPGAQRAVVTGSLVGERTEADFYRARFESARGGEPPSLFAGPYRVSERLSDGLRLRTYFHPGLGELADAYLDAAETYIRRYQAQTGAYAYTDFHIVSAPIPVGLGFPNLAYIGRRVIPLPFMRTRSLAHEVLHNWWGNGIAVDYESGNWAEGLTTFMADYALERDKGEAAARDMRIRWLRDYAALPAGRDQPLRAFRSKRHQAAQVIGYNKAAFLFHMLVGEIGKPAFDDGLRRFWDRHRFGNASWDDLRAAFEIVTGRDLGWFFAQWLDRSGAPRLSLGAHSVEQVDEGYRIRVEIVQPVAGYRFRLPVLLVSADGYERHEVTISETLTRLEWTTSSRPRYIHFDPDSDVFRMLRKNETPPIMRDITLNPKTTVMIGTDDVEFDRIARELAVRLMDVKPRFAAPALGQGIDKPLLLITSTDRLAGHLARLRLSEPPELSGVAHTAAAWTARLENGAAVLVVSANTPAELGALLRPLPHYRGQSYVLFEAGRALGRGVWPVTRGALYRDLSG